MIRRAGLVLAAESEYPGDMEKHPERPRDLDEELTTEIPTAPNRDLGTGGTKEVDKPRNTGDLAGEPDVPVPPPPD